MSFSTETIKDLRTRLKRLLVIYVKIKYNELKLFNLISEEIEKIREDNKTAKEKTSIIECLIKKFNYPRELLVEPLKPNWEVEKFTVTTWKCYCRNNEPRERL